MRPGDESFLYVDLASVQGVARVLRKRSAVAAAQRRVCERIDLAGADPTIGSGLGVFASVWGSGLTALSYELDLLGVELGRSAQAVAAVDRAGRDELL